MAASDTSIEFDFESGLRSISLTGKEDQHETNQSL